MKNIRLFPDSVILIVLCLFAINYSVAQESFKDWLKKDQQALQSYLEKEDKAFMEFLKKDWKAFQSMDGEKSDNKPKPKDIPIAKPEPVKEVTDRPVAPVKIKPIPLAPKPKPKPLVQEITPKANIKFTFFGVPVAFLLDKKPGINISGQINNQVISDSWAVLASSDAVKLIAGLKNYKHNLLLNDWGYIRLVHGLSSEIYKNKKNEQTLCAWFLLLKSGYDVRIAYKRDQIFLLISNENTIYNNQFVTISGHKYYFVSFEGPLDLSGQVYTYEGNYEGSDKMFTMRMAAVPNLTNKIDQRKLAFDYNGNSYSLIIKYNNDIVEYYKNYPQTDIGLYFSSPVSIAAQTTLLSELKPHVEGKSELEAVNLLLRFVQTSFDYKTDDVQFGKEKYLLPEETLFYPASDCEDRSILFSYLIKNLLGMDIVGLDYPGHIATAVKFKSDIIGEGVTYNGQRYIICDPTYINANAGMCMPEFQGINPQIIKF
ncbi:MAG: hypothetical protein JXR46_07035 [Calditrichaceae bacterium]|nr:hypothetical protein [Calditrichaceae bacterium]MBN2708784.1 hypothetical protein [Calditrichaceae bacterium]RQV97686.1 MAG: hypothetical protein EH224_01315 [Calditrichota bacterium]